MKKIITKNQIVFCTDKNQFLYTLFNIWNIHINSSEEIAFHIILDNINDSINEVIADEVFDGIDINLYDFSETQFKTFDSSKEQDHVNSSTYMRLYISEMLPIEVRTILYLDVDTLVIGDISRFFKNVKTTGNYGRAERVGDDFVIENLNTLTPKKKLNKYYNAGVMILDLEEIREQNFILELQSFMELNKDKLLLADQDILNYFLNFNDFHPNYNMGSSDWDNTYLNESDNGVSIVHFFSDVKPWDSKESHSRYLDEKNIFSMSIKDYNSKQEYYDIWVNNYRKFFERIKENAKRFYK